jgi:hypothetical protein
MLIDLSRVRVSDPLSAFATGFADHMPRQGHSQQQARILFAFLEACDYAESNVAITAAGARFETIVGMIQKSAW